MEVVHHLRTREPSPYDPSGFEWFDLDSLAAIRAGILIGYVPHTAREGGIISYPRFSRCIESARKIIEGGTSIKGEVIATREFDEKTVDRIVKLYSFQLAQGENVYHIEGDVKLNWDYNRSTRELIYIIIGRFTDEVSGGKREKVLHGHRVFVPVLKPAFGDAC